MLRASLPKVGALPWLKRLVPQGMQALCGRGQRVWTHPQRVRQGRRLFRLHEVWRSMWAQLLQLCGLQLVQLLIQLR